MSRIEFQYFKLLLIEKQFFVLGRCLCLSNFGYKIILSILAICGADLTLRQDDFYLYLLINSDDII